MIKAWAMVSAGAEVEFEAAIADELIRVGRAVEVKPPEPAPAVTPVSKKEARRDARNAKLQR
jgi:hypothetical protein